MKTKAERQALRDFFTLGVAAGTVERIDRTHLTTRVSCAPKAAAKRRRTFRRQLDASLDFLATYGI